MKSRWKKPELIIYRIHETEFIAGGTLFDGVEFS